MNFSAFKKDKLFPQDVFLRGLLFECSRASTAVNIQPRSKDSNILTTAKLSPRVSCSRMTSGEHCSTNLCKDDFLLGFTNPRQLKERIFMR
jgi:hypothetical protein